MIVPLVTNSLLSTTKYICVFVHLQSMEESEIFDCFTINTHHSSVFLWKIPRNGFSGLKLIAKQTSTNVYIHNDCTLRMPASSHLQQRGTLPSFILFWPLWQVQNIVIAFFCICLIITEVEHLFKDLLVISG